MRRGGGDWSRTVYVARVLLEEALDRPLRPGENSCHTCDHSWCVNPAHLFAGTQAVNLKDMVAKGRSSRGSRHWNARLTPRQVAAIRRSRRPSPELAQRYDMGARQVRKIRQGTRWQVDLC